MHEFNKSQMMDDLACLNDCQQANKKSAFVNYIKKYTGDFTNSLCHGDKKRVVEIGGILI
jgi:hypothetical protein